MDKQITYNNKSVFYRLSGEGYPLVLLHGFAEDGEIWIRQEALLATNYQLIIPDLPGSGRSEYNSDVSMEAMADVVKVILDSESVSEAVVIGHSMGGYVSIAFAEKYPASLKALGFFASTSFADSEEKKAARNKNIRFIEKNGSYEFLKQSTPGLFSDIFKKENNNVVESLIEQYKNFDNHVLSAYQQAMIARPDRRKILKEIVKPVLFIIGEHDNAISFDDSMAQCHLPALSYIHILKNSGHMGMLEETEKSNEILQLFLADTW